MKNQKCHDQQITLSHPVIESLRALVDYVYHDEQQSFEEAGNPKQHIFRDILILETWLATQD